MKKVLLLTAIFAVCGFVAGCSSDSKSSKKSTVTIESDGMVVESLVLGSNETVNLKAILKDKDGNLVENYTTNWTCSERVGSFSENNASETLFTALDGSMSGTDVNITADCNGVKKKIKVEVEKLTVSLSMSGGNTVSNTGTKQIKATVTRAGVEVADVSIIWSTSEETYPGTFAPATTYSGQYVIYTPASGARGSLYVRATVYGIRSSVLLNITN